jgi:hypothetical protein
MLEQCSSDGEWACRMHTNTVTGIRCVDNKDPSVLKKEVVMVVKEC